MLVGFCTTLKYPLPIDAHGGGGGGGGREYDKGPPRNIFKKLVEKMAYKTPK
jgi:hypothetical protein